MCEILVKAIDQTNKDPEKDRMGCYKQGYPVGVWEDGYDLKQHAEVKLPKFWIIKLPGIKKKDFQPYCREEMQGNELYRRREYKFDLTAPVISQLNVDGEIALNIVGWQNGLVRVGGG